MSEFSGHPLVMGSVRGARVFGVDGMGRLTGVTHKQVWTPGENEASCKIPEVSEEAAAEMRTNYYSGEGYTYSIGGIRIRHAPSYRIEGTEHNLSTCQCGFYAYYDGGKNDYDATGEVHGVVEAWGETTIGSRGFRSSKAKILALAVPAPDISASIKMLKRWRAMLTAIAFGMVCGLFATVSGLIREHWFVFGIGVGSLIVNAVCGIYNYRTQRPKFPVDDSAKLRERIARNYADVPMFKSVDEMLAAFPPDRGAEPSPETDDEFWTRVSA